MYNNLIDERAIALAHYIIESKDTVRGAAKKFGISKSTVHKDVSERLQKINGALAKEVREVLNDNGFDNSNIIYLEKSERITQWKKFINIMLQHW